MSWRRGSKNHRGEAFLDVRLVQLMGSFIGARSQYALVRLEFAMHDGRVASPPLVGALTDASERALHEEWPEIERQIESAMVFVKRMENGDGSERRDRVTQRWLLRSVREMDQYARAIRWVMTVTESEER